MEIPQRSGGITTESGNMDRKNAGSFASKKLYLIYILYVFL
ncbi:hypothetical protein FLJC2902T_24100 [Flavobacterium limnosediminis JC2902]|uniref:Uncharacterized protein n=1 Tax=Flavobacterium limnosediminis JC2902 TaxID=1341181 RepID=V6SK29_9FLAO|nr:hypothetical protein FLJC2902T_24100 [Flavobacterium limnosediminis JC2902]